MTHFIEKILQTTYRQSFFRIMERIKRVNKLIQIQKIIELVGFFPKFFPRARVEFSKCWKVL
jgi:hypothetical protein